MADTKTVTSKFTLGVACPKKSVPLKLPNEKTGKLEVVEGQYERVELKHIPAGEPVALPADEADVLIARGQAVEVVAEPASGPKAKKSDD